MVRAGQASRLTISYDNKVIDTDITAAQVQLWNSGRKAIKRDNILKPIVIYTENNIPILEATIRKSSREIINLSLNTDELQQGRVTVPWNILEQNDGAIIQLIYAGNTDVQIKVDGIIEGQPKSEQYTPERRVLYGLGGRLFIFLGIALLFSGLTIRNSKQNYINSSKSNIEAAESLIKSYNSSSEVLVELLGEVNKSIAQAEEQTKKYEGDEKMKSLLVASRERIETYKELSKVYRKRVKEEE